MTDKAAERIVEAMLNAGIDVGGQYRDMIASIISREYAPLISAADGMADRLSHLIETDEASIHALTSGPHAGFMEDRFADTGTVFDFQGALEIVKQNKIALESYRKAKGA